MSGKLKRKDDSKKDCGRETSFHKPLLLFCGQGGNTQFTSPNDSPVNIGSVKVDTSSLVKPQVKIKFSSVVDLTGISFSPEALLTFRLFRVCDGGVPFPLQNWVYEVFQINQIDALLKLNTSFAFIFCDRSKCPRQCEYFVEVSIDNLVNAEVTVNNVQIQALAQ